MSAELGQLDDPVDIAYCPQHGLHGERQECFVCGGPVEQVRMVPVVGGTAGTAWLVWGRRVADDRSRSVPLGCYATKAIALEAERMAKEHPNAPFWADIWVTPWPLATEPMINFRMGYEA